MPRKRGRASRPGRRNRNRNGGRAPLSQQVEVGTRQLSQGETTIALAADATLSAKIVSVTGTVAAATPISFQVMMKNVVDSAGSFTAVSRLMTVGTSSFRFSLGNPNTTDFVRSGDIGVVFRTTGTCRCSYKITYHLQPPPLPISQFLEQYAQPSFSE